MRLWFTALLLTAATAGAALAQASGGRDPAGYKIAPTVIYCMQPSGRVEPCGGPDTPLNTVLKPATDPTAGLQLFRIMSPEGPVPMVAKSSAGRLFSYNFCNSSNMTRYVRFYDSASPTAGTTAIAAGPIIVAAGSCQQFTTSFGLVFRSGISLAVTGGMDDNDVTATGDGDITGFLGYQ